MRVRAVTAAPGDAPGPEAVAPQPARQGPPSALFWIVPLVLMAAAAGYLVYRNANADRRTAAGGKGAVAVGAVSLGDLYSTVRISGTVVAERSAIIRAPRILGSRGDVNRGGGGAHDHGPAGHPDFILNLIHLARAGTHVRAGDVVAEFDPENQLQRLDDYRDSVVQLRNQIGKMTADLVARKETHEQAVRTAHADWQKALLDLKTSPVRSRVDAEKMRLTAEEAELKYKELVAQQGLVEESQQASIRASQLALDKSAIELERAQNNVKRMTMTAPIAGTVVFASVVLNGDLRQIRSGDQVAPGQPVLYIVDTTSMALNGTVNQVDAERLRLGMRATMRLDAYPQFRVGGTLIGIGAMAKVSRFRPGYVGQIPVRLRIDSHDSSLLPDLTGSADIVTGAESNVLLAPRPAVFTDNGQAFVCVKDGDGWMRKAIVTGLASGTHVAIRAGLQPGEIIALQWPL